MARKGKIGIDYFSHDVDMLQDKKIKIIKAKHGLVGYAVYLRLLEELYRENGYYLQIDEDFNILFSDDNRLDYNVYISILNDCIEKELFNKKMYENYKILTSNRIQINFCSATERRKEVEFISEYLLVDLEKKYTTGKVNVSILSLNADISTQSKEKVKRKEIEIESKSKEIRLTKLENLVSEIKILKLSERLEKKFIEFIKYRKNETKKELISLRPINSAIKNVGKDFKDENHLIDSIEESMNSGWMKIVPTRNFKSTNNSNIEESYIDKMIRENKHNDILEAEEY